MTSQSLSVRGLKGNVTIRRDEWGIPAIFAKDNHSLFFGYGYAVAEDRLFQMEVSRLESWGRMAEVFGGKSLESDKRARLLGARHRALHKTKTLEPLYRDILEGYVAGINAFIETHDASKRQGFCHFGFAPERWTVEDVMTISESLRFEDPVDKVWKLVEKVGLGMARELYPAWPPETPVIVPESEMAKNGEVYSRLKQMSAPPKRALSPLFERSETGSNNCVVTASKSSTGKPILLGDPQMSPRVPSAFHEAVLHGGDFHCRGIGAPGRPGIMVGFTARTAWAVTGLGGDRSDVYVEKLHPQNPDLYLYRGAWEPVEKRTEVLKVKNAQDVTFEVRSTHHGVICSELIGEKEKTLALRHVLSETNDTSVLDYLRINRAKNYTEFKEAVSEWQASTANLIYADREGNIAYWPAGAFPLRSKGYLWGPLPGWTGEYEWDGFVPFDEMPTVLNPDQDFIVTANNLIVGEWYPYHFIKRSGTGTRFQRLREILLSPRRFSPADMERVVRPDITCSPEVRKLVPLIVQLVSENQRVSPDVKKAAARLAEWDYRFSAASVAATIFYRFVSDLKESVGRPHVGDALDLGTPGWEIIHLAPDSAWFDDPSTPKVETRDDVVLKTFCDAVSKLIQQLGPDQDQWQWRKVSHARISHQLTELDPSLKSSVPDYGQFVMEGGKALTPHVLEVVSYSQVVDLSNVDKSRAVLAVGDSELYQSPHSADQTDLWANFKLRPAPLSEDKVIAASDSELTLRGPGS